MARPGRKAFSDRPVDWKISIRGSIAAQIELYFTDPITGRVKKGARSQLINQLLSDWLERQQKQLDTSDNSG